MSVLISVGLVATAAYATTTIGTDIDTDGTLTVAGATVLNGGLTMDTNKFAVADATGTITLANGAILLNGIPIAASTDPSTNVGGGLVMTDILDSTFADAGGNYVGIRSNVEVDEDQLLSRQVSGIGTRIKVASGKIAKTINATELVVDVSEGGDLPDGSFLRGMLIEVKKHTSYDFDYENALDIWANSTNALANSINLGGAFTNAINLSGATATTGINLGDNCTTGIDIGSATTGIDFNGTFTGDVISVGDSTTPLTTGTTGLNGIGVYYTYSKANGGSLTGINSTVEYIGTDTDYGSINGVTGTASIKTTKAVGGTAAAYLSGAMGVIDVSGTINNSAAYLSGVAGIITGSGTFTKANFITAGFFTNHVQKDLTSNIKSSLVLLRNDGLTASQLDTIWRIAAPDTNYFFVFEPGTAGGWWNAGGTDCDDSGSTDLVGTIKLKDANGNDAYIRVWAAK